MNDAQKVIDPPYLMEIDKSKLLGYYKAFGASDAEVDKIDREITAKTNLRLFRLKIKERFTKIE